MVRSLSLSAYMAYARRVGQSAPLPGVTRPDGELIWGHATSQTRAAALCQITERLAQQRPGVRLLLTAPDKSCLPEDLSAQVLYQPLPAESVAAAEAFLNHWRPSICLWTGGELRPALITCADAKSVPLFLLDAEEGMLANAGWRWFPDLPRSLMDMFAQVQAQTEQTARAMRRIGASDENVIVASALRPETLTLPYHESDREDLATRLRGRPLWLAAHLHLEELDTVLRARHAVARLSHRALLILAPQDRSEAAGFRERLTQDGLPVACWADGEMPEDTTEILFAEDGAELGLWYRLAPVSFIGGSLMPGMQGNNPNEPAVHGSAILYGPNVRRYLADYSRFAEAGAARIVRDAETLAAAVQSLIAPDQAAVMAHAGWDIASRGAEATDRILDLVQDALDIVASS